MEVRPNDASVAVLHRQLTTLGGCVATLESSRTFWETKAAENPYWYVSSFGPYENRNLHEFWASGFGIWQHIKSATGYTPRPTDSVVEIGCGVGRLTRAISRDVGQIEAFDISQQMLELANQHELPNVRFHLANGDNLHPLADDSADLVLAYCVFQHLPSVDVLKKYVDEMLRVAKPGETCAFTLSQRTWQDNFRPMMKLKAKVRDMFSVGPKGLGADEWLGIRPTHEEVRRLCRKPLNAVSMGNGQPLFWFSK
jgi:SAM-dependent methyltransferase